MNKTKSIIKKILDGLQITDMTNFDILWSLMIETLHKQHPKPTFVTTNSAFTQYSSTRAIVEAGIKEKLIRTNDKNEVALEDVQFYTNLKVMFNKGKEKGIVREIEVLGYKKYEIRNVREHGVSSTKHQTRLMTEFVNDYIQQVYGISLDQIAKDQQK